MLSAALLLPVVLFSAVWTSFALWRCRYDGIARTQCCCPKNSENATKQAAESSATAALVAGKCCQVEHHEVDRAPAEARGNAAYAAAAAAAVLAAIPAGLLAPFEPPLLRSVLVWLEDDGPPHGRTLVAQKQALLI